MNIWAKTNLAMNLAQKQHAQEGPLLTENTLPSSYRDYKDVFKKSALEHFPEFRLHDHAIELEPDFIPKNCVTAMGRAKVRRSLKGEQG